MNVIQLGPLLVNYKLLIFIVSASIGYVALTYRLHALGAEKPTGERFVQAMLLGFVTWKLSPILFDPVSVLRYPMSLIYFDGGEGGFVLALLLSFAYLWIRSRRDGTFLGTNLDLLGAGWLAFSSIQHLFLFAADPDNGIFYSLHLLLNAVLAFCLYANTNTDHSHVRANRCWLWYSLGMVGIFYARKDRVFWIAGFTKEQVIFLLVCIIALGLDNILNHKKKKEVH